MFNSKYYKKSIDIRNETEKTLREANQRKDIRNTFSITEDVLNQSIVDSCRTAMNIYAKTIRKVLPVSVLSNLPILPMGAFQNIYQLNEIVDDEVYSKHKARNRYLSIIFGKAEYYDAKSDAYNMGIQINKQAIEIENERIKYDSMSEMTRVADKLRHLLMHNTDIISKINYRCMTDTQLFDIYAGLKLYETLNIVIGGF